MNAQQINNANRKPLTDEQLEDLRKKIDSGKVFVMKRRPIFCPTCHNEMTIQYIGHRNDTAEILYRCGCGEINYG